MERAIARVKRKVFQPITKIFYPYKECTYEYFTQEDMITACIVLSNLLHSSDTIKPHRTD